MEARARPPGDRGGGRGAAAALRRALPGQRALPRDSDARAAVRGPRAALTRRRAERACELVHRRLAVGRGGERQLDLVSAASEVELEPGAAVALGGDHGLE